MAPTEAAALPAFFKFLTCFLSLFQFSLSIMTFSAIQPCNHAIPLLADTGWILAIPKLKMAGQEGLEPPAPGFGVRCSTIRATGLRILILQPDPISSQASASAACPPPGKNDTAWRSNSAAIRFIFLLFTFLMERMLPVKRTVLFQLQLVRHGTLVFCCGVIASLAHCTPKCNNFSHDTLRKNTVIYSIISETTPAPTVLPPSRIANRSPSSMAIG